MYIFHYFLISCKLCLTFYILGEELVHRTVHTKGAVEFSYSEDDLCGHTVSDHNYYSICYVSNSVTRYKMKST